MKRLWLCYLASLALTFANAGAQEPSGSSTPAVAPAATTASAPAPAAEMTHREVPLPSFRSRVNLVLVPVVVRDSKGRAVGGLHQSDFQILEKGKPQTIKSFEAIQREASPSAVRSSGAASSTAPGAVEEALPKRFVAYIFDDWHLRFTALSLAREAAERHMKASLQPTDRVALYTASRDQMVEFTGDQEKVSAALTRVSPHVGVDAVSEDDLAGSDAPGTCPALTYFEADMIENKEMMSGPRPSGPYTLAALAQDCPALAAFNSNVPSSVNQSASSHNGSGGNSSIDTQPQSGGPVSDMPNNKLSLLRTETGQVLARGNEQTRVMLELLSDVEKRMETLPGERVLVIVSEGFHLREWDELQQIVNRAARAHIVINTVNAGGLRVLTGTTQTMAASDLDSSLAGLSDGTGGVHVANSNDLDSFFAHAVERPETMYLLGFAPQNLKSDGGYHHLHVKLVAGHRLSVQAREGFYAPAHPADPAKAAAQEMAAAMFSQDEIRDIPLEVRTQYNKLDAARASLDVYLHLNPKTLPFQQVDGRNRDDLAIYVALFDRNGNYVAGRGETIEMRLRDATLDALGTGMDVSEKFEAPAGNYLLRAVVRDAAGEQVAAVNKAVQIQ